MIIIVNIGSDLVLKGKMESLLLRVDYYKKAIWEGAGEWGAKIQQLLSLICLH